MSRRSRGEGTIFQRKDGRWCAQVFVTLPDGARVRKAVLAHSQVEARDRLSQIREQERRNLPFVRRGWTVGEFVEDWMEKTVKARNRPSTYDYYEQAVRLHIRPLLGRTRIDKLNVQDVQQAIYRLQAQGCSPRVIHRFRETLSSALTCAMRREIVFRNVARLVELPGYTPKPVTIWTPEQTRQFLAAAASHQWYVAYYLTRVYGLREGEALGLRWCDVDFGKNEFRVRQQVQRAGGELRVGKVKTKAGERPLPLVHGFRERLLTLAAERGVPPGYQTGVEPGPDGLITESATGRPVEPRNFLRTFRLLSNKLGLPLATIHSGRHGVATFLKDLGVPDRDIQAILGHADIQTTKQVYQHGTTAIQAAALDSIDQALAGRAIEQISPTKQQLLSELQQNQVISLIMRKGKRPADGPPTAVNLPDNPGGGGWIRTNDLMVMRHIPTLLTGLPTPVITHLRTRANCNFCGLVAVRTAVNSPTQTAAFFTETAARIRLAKQTCQAALTEKLRLASFPCNLLPRSTTS
ncbi:MAG: site-specific integrase [Actinomycetia bacterium]|nr:site-specific integrase [Actinomycetes bacterium]